MKKEKDLLWNSDEEEAGGESVIKNNNNFLLIFTIIELFRFRFNFHSLWQALDDRWIAFS